MVALPLFRALLRETGELVVSSPVSAYYWLSRIRPTSADSDTGV